MRILSTDMAMYAEHASLSVSKKQASITTIQPNRNDNATSPKAERPHHPLHFHTATNSQPSVSKTDTTDEDSKLPPEVAKMKKAIESLMAWISGKTIKMDIFSDSDLKPTTTQTSPSIPTPPNITPQPNQTNTPQTGMIMQASQSYFEGESLSVGMSGAVTTADGKSINFNLAMSMSRSFYSEQSIEIRTGAALQDPLVVNYGGQPAQLALNKVNFDLNGDGTQEALPELSAGSAYLAIDKNGNGSIDDGSELFGPNSGNGFADLSALDEDGNGWIDEADTAFAKLSIWQPNSRGENTLVALGKLGIGALHTQGIDAPFDYKDSNNTLQGKMQKAGMFLFEDGRAGSMQQIDIAA